MQARLTICTLLVVLCMGVLISAQAIPKSFDIRDKHPQCSTILDQGACGSCWAFSSTQGLSDRICIATGQKNILSPQYLINCDTNDQGGCQGGSTLNAYEFFQRNGNDKLSCSKYYSGDTSETGICPRSCDSSSEPFELFYAHKGYSLKGNSIKETVENIQRDLITYGSVSASFIVYTDFISFFQQNRTGVYVHTGGVPKGGHAVKIVGYGTTPEGVDYWTVANSWSTLFGDNGYFKIRRGTDEATIESRLITAGIPNTNRRFNMGGPAPHYARPFSAQDLAVVDGAFQESPIDHDVFEAYEHIIATQQVKKERVLGIKKAYTQVVNGINIKLDIMMQPSARDMASNKDSVVSVVVHKCPVSSKLSITNIQ